MSALVREVEFVKPDDEKGAVVAKIFDENMRVGENYDTIKNGVQGTLPVLVSVYAHPKGDL